jgi:RNA polymerase sigma factor (sigma-70 family)
VEDLDGFAAFCADAHHSLVAAVAHQTGDRRLAEELVQEALIRAAEHWSRVSELASPAGWTFAVAANLGRSYFRRYQAERRALRRIADRRQETTADESDGLGVRLALQRLPFKQREAVVLRYYLQLSVDETADAMNTTPGAVRALTHRAVNALRARLALVPDPEEVNDVT